MEQIVFNVIQLAWNKLQNQSVDQNVRPMMNYIQNDFEKLLNCEITDEILLFCRQMKRMIDYNDFISYQLVFEWHEDICCLIKELNDQQLDNHSLERFRSKMNLEKKLEERQLQFHQTIGDRKTLSEFIHQYERFFQEYRQQCLSCHSKIRIELIERNPSEYIEINFDCSKQLFQLCKNNFIQNNFLPSVKYSDAISLKHLSGTIENLLASNR